MRNINILFAALGLLFFSILFSNLSSAEPWLATRMAQNCAACHAPGRVNVPAKARRCTLSCQGCHTNPSGGGLRNTYGKWNQERWLNSLYLKSYKMNRPRPMPTEMQFYTDKSLKGLKPDKKKKAALQGFPLRETTVFASESRYDRRSTQEKFVEPDAQLALARIPQDDPWRQRRENYFNAGADLRYFNLNSERDSVRTKSGFLMGTDVGASAEPVSGTTLVVEGRFLNGPDKPAWDAGFETSSQVRSAYVLVDDLPYNTFVQYGLYRPMFGNYSPDHTSLFSEASGLGQRAVFKTLSIGTAPNVPFFNFHYIQPTNQNYSQDKGMVVNLGARFVTMGAYGMLSYWNTKNTDGVTKLTMTSLTGGLTYGRYTGVYDLSQIVKRREQAKLAGGSLLTKDSGLSMTIENRYRLWRENYAAFIYEKLNTGTDLNAGSATAMQLGIHSFLISSVELEFSYRDEKLAATASELNNAGSTSVKTVLGQIHLFF